MREYDLKKALSTGSYTRNSIRPQLLVAEDGEYRQGDILDANATMEVVNSTTSNIDDKLNDILGIDNGAVQELVEILSDSDTTTGILNELAKKANISDLSSVTTSGSYDDLSNKPHIPEDPVQSDWAEDDTTDQAYIKNKPTIPTKLSDLQNDTGLIPAATTVNANGHEYVEIAGIKWATMNIGALTETDCGLYFAWGDSQGYTVDQIGSGNGKKYFDDPDYKYGDGTYTGASSMTKYNTVDNKIMLDPEDDAAIVNWGGSWRIPTKEEFVALGNACKFIDANGVEITTPGKLTILNNVTGIYLEDKTDSTKRLFFPVSGLAYRGTIVGLGPTTEWPNQTFVAEYWANSLNDDLRVNTANSFGFNDDVVLWDQSGERMVGATIRAVLDETNTLHKVATTGDYNDLVNKPIIRSESLTLNLSDQASTITGANNSGKVEIVIYDNTSLNDYTVSIDSSYKTVDGNQIVLSIPAGCYGEVCYTNIGGTIFAKGIKQLANS